MKKLNFMTIIAVMIALISFGKLQAQDANQILTNIDNTLKAPKDIVENMSITLVSRSGQKQVRTATAWMKGSDKRLFKFNSPASVKGIGFLSLPNDLMYLYMPAYGRERRIASSVKNQKFAGTDLTYDEMQSKDYNKKYSAKILENKSNSYVLQLTPKQKSAYSKLIMTVAKSNGLPTSIESYDKSGRKVKTATTVFAKSGKYWYAKTMTVKDLKTKHSTIMKVTSVKFDSNLSNEIFTVRNLKK
jgi:outer membrane lipoprotein-sorting protein